MGVLCRFACAALIVTALAAATLPAASGDDDATRARDAVAAGRILPLSAIIERALARYGGTVLDVEYEDDDHDHGRDGRPGRQTRYEVKLLTDDGRIVKLEYDAVTGELLRERGHRRAHQRGAEDD